MSMQGRFEILTGEVLAEGPVTEHGPSDPPRLGAPAANVPSTPDEHWVIPGVADVAEGTEGVLVIDDGRRVDVLLMNGRLYERP
jgi:hypothetical protein